MNPLHLLHRRLRSLFHRRRVEAEMAEEMRFHLEQRAAEYVADGLSATDACYAAQRKFGHRSSIEEQARENRGWSGLERLGKDLRFAFRQLTRKPGFTLLAIVTLGLGIGANTSMFSVLNGILLKPLPYQDVEQLDRFYRVTAQNREGHFSAADFLDFQRVSDGYGEVATYSAGNESLSTPGQPAVFVYTARATLNLFQLLGVQPQLGRDFHGDEATPGRDRVVLISQRTWQNHLGGSPDVVGQSLRLDGETCKIVGVLPASFNDWRYLGEVDVFRPLALTPEQAADRSTTGLRVVGRRSAERSQADGAGLVTNFGRRLATDFPQVNTGSSWRTVPLQDAAGGENGMLIIPLLMGLSGFVLLIACSNLANLLLARTMTQAREFAVRAALGASRLQLLRPLLAEALLLAIAGGVVAVILALWFHDWAAVRSTGDNGERVHFALDWRVMSWAFGGALFTAIAFGLAPALFAARLNLNATLKSGGRTATGGQGHQRFRQVLIIGQFTLAMMLLGGAGLFIRGLYEINTRREGWSSEHLVTGSILLPAAKYSDTEKIASFHRLFLERLAALPGATSVSIASSPPFYPWPTVNKFITDHGERSQPGHEPAALVNHVSPHYFATVGTHVLAGRAFGERDRAGATPVFIISQTTARGLFGTDAPIGRRIAQLEGETLTWGEIVGVVRDVQSIATTANPVVFQVYRPIAQVPTRQMDLAVRTSGLAPSAVIESIRALVAGLDPDLPVRRLLTADARIERATYQLGVLRDMLTAIAVLGLGLASLGVYGVIARTMAERTSEFAIRLALGASIQDITRMVLTSGVKLALIGSAFGLVGALAVSRVLAASFTGLPMNGVSVLLGTTLLLIVVALLACWVPARRASKVDTMAVLRAE